MSARADNYRSLFAVEGFGRLIGGMLLGRTAGVMGRVALVLFALQRFHSATMAGLTLFLAIFPGVLLGPIGGALLDRHGRGRLVVLDYVLAAGSFSAIGALSLVGSPPVAVFFALVSAASLTRPLSETGLRTLFPLTVPPHLWDRANALDSGVYVVSDMVGSPLGAVLAAGAHPEVSLVATAVVYAAAALMTTGVRDPGGITASGDGLLTSAAAGVVYFVRNPTLRALAVVVSVGNFGGGIVAVGLPVVVLSRLHLGAAAVGLFLALLSVAAGVSVAWVGRFDSRGTERRLLALGSAASAGAVLLIAWAPNSLLIGCAVVVLGLAQGPLDIGLFALRQRRTDPAWMGRAFAISMSANFIGFPLGSALGGPALDRSVPGALAVAAVANLVAAACVALIPAGGVDGLEPSPDRGGSTG